MFAFIFLNTHDSSAQPSYRQSKKAPMKVTKQISPECFNVLNSVLNPVLIHYLASVFRNGVRSQLARLPSMLCHPVRTFCPSSPTSSAMLGLSTERYDTRAGCRCDNVNTMRPVYSGRQACEIKVNSTASPPLSFPFRHAVQILCRRYSPYSCSPASASLCSSSPLPAQHPLSTNYEVKVVEIRVKEGEMDVIFR
ncbi:hypothetical protein Agabi119p4_5637 [Agaricus bisporus var. burnettii]|uniref:Uncharacterized protein n=1 Tax=Agaricus bisporus var. burnettii TaxID=192524 RepID=A0A8H7KGC8_AGABI|nr:hypothetical protein Agabi119p4_5637 [Agaricus bisporus var. burnettii]